MVSSKLHTVLIEKLVPGGLGLGRLADGMVVLVRYVLPGEKVVVRETARKRDFVNAVLHEVLTPSPDRIEPPCPYYGRCGGCDLQHAGYSAQTLLKKKIVIESLQRAAADMFSGMEIPVLPALGSPEQFGYRQRIRLQANEQGLYGFFRSESHDLEAVSQCLLARDSLNSVLQQLHVKQSFRQLAKQCTAIELLFNPGADNTVMLLHFRRKPRPQDSILAADTARDISGLSAILLQVESHGLFDPLLRSFVSTPPSFFQVASVENLISDITLSWEVTGFCQVNLGQNMHLINLVLKMLKTCSHDRVLDLYCGFGNFSLPIAQIAAKVVGIDSQNAAIRSAQHNAKFNKAHNCYFEKKQVAEGVADLISAGESFDAVVLDPPRQGAADIVSMLPGLNAAQIIYISCNPATLARDLAILCTQGYLLSQLVPVDMFPQTHHMESVALLKQATRQ